MSMDEYDIWGFKKRRRECVYGYFEKQEKGQSEGGNDDDDNNNDDGSERQWRWIINGGEREVDEEKKWMLWMGGWEGMGWEGMGMRLRIKMGESKNNKNKNRAGSNNNNNIIIISFIIIGYYYYYFYHHYYLPSFQRLIP